MTYINKLQTFIHGFQEKEIENLPELDSYILSTKNRDKYIFRDFISMLDKNLIVGKAIHSVNDLFHVALKDDLSKSDIISIFHGLKDIQYIDDLVIITSKKVEIENKGQDSKSIVVKQQIIDKKQCILICGPLSDLGTNLVNLTTLLNGIEIVKVHNFRLLPLDKLRPRYKFQEELELIKSHLPLRNLILKEELELIWWERNESQIYRSFQKLIFMLVSKIQEFDEFYVNNTFHKFKNPIKHILKYNFMIGLSGGYSRGEFGKYSDIDLVIIHEGPIDDMIVAGNTLHGLLTNIEKFNLCEWHSLFRLNFHRSQLGLLVNGILTGEITVKKRDIETMISSIEMLRNEEMTVYERKKSIKKYYWSLMKGILDVLPIYENPIGIGSKLRDEFYEIIRENQSKFIKEVYEFDAFIHQDFDNFSQKFFNAPNNNLNDVFKGHSGIISIQDIGTFLSILGDFPIQLYQTKDRLIEAVNKEMIPGKIGDELAEIYVILQEIKYLNKTNIPVDSLKELSLRVKELVILTYEHLMEVE